MPPIRNPFLPPPEDVNNPYGLVRTGDGTFAPTWMRVIPEDEHLRTMNDPTYEPQRLWMRNPLYAQTFNSGNVDRFETPLPQAHQGPSGSVLTEMSIAANPNAAAPSPADHSMPDAFGSLEDMEQFSQTIEGLLNPQPAASRTTDSPAQADGQDTMPVEAEPSSTDLAEPESSSHAEARPDTTEPQQPAHSIEWRSPSIGFSYDEGIFVGDDPIPEEIKAIIDEIHGIELNDEGLPRRGKLPAILEHFTGGGFLSIKSPLFEWRYDTRLLSAEAWKHLIDHRRDRKRGQKGR